MKKTLLVSILILILCSCAKDTETKKLSLFLQSFAVDIKNYKVICFVPSDGCTSCIYPSVDYSKKAGKDFLLVLTSLYKKSNNYIVESHQLEILRIVTDNQNLACRSQIVSQIAPCFYFLVKGHIIKKVDLSKTYDKTSILKEVDQFLLK